MDPLSTFHICPFHFCAISEDRALEVYAISLFNGDHYAWLINSSQTSHVSWIRSLWVIHLNRITTTMKRQRAVFGFQGPQFQLHKEQVWLAVVRVLLGNWLAHRKCLPDISKLESRSPGIPVMCTVTTKTKTRPGLWVDNMGPQTTWSLFLPESFSFTQERCAFCKGSNICQHLILMLKSGFKCFLSQGTLHSNRGQRPKINEWSSNSGTSGSNYHGRKELEERKESSRFMQSCSYHLYPHAVTSSI